MMPPQALQTEFEFQLPRGYLDPSGQVHRQGRMRLATAMDEIGCMQDPRLQANEAYLPVLLLSRVITRLGSLPAVTLQTVENLFASDLAFLENLYLELNSPDPGSLAAVCPNCGTPLQVHMGPETQPEGNSW
jgi:hypothetical protein